MKKVKVTLIVLTIIVVLLLFQLYSTIERSKLSLSNKSYTRFEITKLKSNSLRTHTLRARREYIPLYKNKSAEVYLYNSNFPGPTIRAKQGDTIKVQLNNKLLQKTTIHWHGVQVKNFMDGVPNITQKAILPNEKYTYKFKVENSGIYWYHPHKNSAHQVEMGLYGALIVDEKEDIIKSDKDIILMLDDVRIGEDFQISQEIYGHDLMHGRVGNILLTNGKPQFNFKAKKGDLIRLRLINPSNARVFNFAVQNHELLIIGHDIGLLEKPYTTDIITISSGERFDILIYAKNSGNFSYFTKHIQETYNLGNIEITDTNKKDKKDIYENLKSKVLNPNIPNWDHLNEEQPDFNLELFPSDNLGEFQWVINNKSSNYKPEKINLKEGKLYKIKIKNLHGQIHPMHIHGQKFQILTRNGVKVRHKGFKDTILVYGGEVVEIGFIAEGKGIWINHCHILEHSEVGMLMHFVVT